MTEAKGRLRRKTLGWCILLLLLLGGFILVQSGVIWFNMPSRTKYPVRGVDVSHYQGDIDFPTIKAQGMSFVFIKATEGSGTVDERFAENWQNARDAGLLTGAYHFFSFGSAAETQADNFIASVPYAEDALPPVIDLEYYSGSGSDALSADEVRGMLRMLLNRLRETYGKTPIIYTTSACYEDYLADGALGEDFILWIRSVFTAPDSSLDWQLWQYDPRGVLKGYTGGERFIDLNVFRGTEEELRRLGAA